MANYKRGQHPNSQANLGRPRTAGGKKNITLSSQAIEWLEAQGKGKQASAVERLIQKAIVDEPVVEEDWLREHGTIFALSHFHHLYKQAARKLDAYEKAFQSVDEILCNSGVDDDLYLADAVEAGKDLLFRQLENEMNKAESLINQINSYEWLETSERSLEILNQQGISVYRTTKEKFEM